MSEVCGTRKKAIKADLELLTTQLIDVEIKPSQVPELAQTRRDLTYSI